MSNYICALKNVFSIAPRRLSLASPYKGSIVVHAVCTALPPMGLWASPERQNNIWSLWQQMQLKHHCAAALSRSMTFLSGKKTSAKAWQAQFVYWSRWGLWNFGRAPRPGNLREETYFSPVMFCVLKLEALLYQCFGVTVLLITGITCDTSNARLNNCSTSHPGLIRSQWTSLKGDFEFSLLPF